MEIFAHWLLTTLLLLPVTGAFVLLFPRRESHIRWTSLAFTLAAFLLSLSMLIPFDRRRPGGYAYGPAGTVQMLCQFEWFPTLHAGYRVAIDGLSLPLVILATLVFAAACGASFGAAARVRLGFVLLLLFESAVLGVLLAFDVLMFTVFLGLMISIAALLIAVRGGDRRRWAAVRFSVFQFAGLACLVAVLWRFHGGTCDLVELAAGSRAGIPAAWLTLALAGFLVRLPVFPLHGWVHGVLRESSPAVAMMLLALVPLTGGYGLFRIVLALFPHAMAWAWPGLSALALATIAYGSLAAIGEDEPHRAIALTFTSAAGFVVLGLAALSPLAMAGALLALVAQALAWGWIALLLGSASGEEPRDGRSPRATLFSLAWLSQCVMPGVLAQWTVVLGIFSAARNGSMLRTHAGAAPATLYSIAIAAAIGSVLFAWAGVHIMRRLFAGPSAARDGSAPSAAPEVAALVPVAALTLLLGVVPAALLFRYSRPAIDAVIRLMH